MCRGRAIMPPCAFKPAIAASASHPCPPRCPRWRSIVREELAQRLVFLFQRIEDAGHGTLRFECEPSFHTASRRPAVTFPTRDVLGYGLQLETTS